MANKFSLESPVFRVQPNDEIVLQDRGELTSNASSTYQLQRGDIDATIFVQGSGGNANDLIKVFEAEEIYKALGNKLRIGGTFVTTIVPDFNGSLSVTLEPTTHVRPLNGDMRFPNISITGPQATALEATFATGEALAIALTCYEIHKDPTKCWFAYFAKPV